MCVYSLCLKFPHDVQGLHLEACCQWPLPLPNVQQRSYCNPFLLSQFVSSLQVKSAPSCPTLVKVFSDSRGYFLLLHGYFCPGLTLLKLY